MIGAPVVGVLALLAFVLWERRVADPLMPPTLFGSRNFAVGNLVTVPFYAAVSLGTLLVALFLQETGGFSATAAGLATLPIPVLSFLSSRCFGALAGTYGPRWFMTVGPLVAAAGFLLLTRVGQDVQYWTQVLPGLVVFGAGLSITVSPLTSAVLAAVTPHQSGIASAVNNAVSRVAGLVAIAFVGVAVGGAPDLAGFRQGAAVVAGLFVLAGLAGIGIRNATHDADRISAEALAHCQDRAAPPPALRK